MMNRIQPRSARCECASCFAASRVGPNHTTAREIRRVDFVGTGIEYDIEYDRYGAFVPPPADVRLPGAHVFLLVVSNNIPVRQRNVRWPADFNLDGWPMGDPVILWAFGLPLMTAYADYYILARSTLRHYFWLLDEKTPHDSLPVCGFHFGQLIARPDLLLIPFTSIP
jgi:hypothetical protein